MSNSNIKVAKFGGSSLADAASIERVCGIVESDPARRVVVVSAPGKRSSDDAKVTDMLMAAAEQAISESAASVDLAPIVARYAEIQAGLRLDPAMTIAIERDLVQRLALADGDPRRFMDSMKAAGEDNNARLVAAALQARGLQADYVNPQDAGMVLGGDYGNGYVLPETYANLASLASRSAITVFPGFFGYTAGGDVITFPRGGSDITGAILAAAVKADVYENFTDVDSVCAADPRIVPQAAPIPELTYAEMRELAYGGFGVFHDEALEPAVRAQVPVRIKNSRHPDLPGTVLLPVRAHNEDEVVGIASDEGFCMLFVSKYLMNRELGFGRRLLEILEQEGVPFEHMPSGIDSLSLILRESSFDATTESRVLERVRAELGADEAYADRGLALIMVVGEGMRFHVGIAARATRALAAAGANIKMINQGATEISMMFGVKVGDCAGAVKSLYTEFFPE
jgi:aspartate kinase